MGGVDLTDQLTQYYDPMRRCRKWWKKLFFHLFSLMPLNAYKLYVQQKANPAKREHKAFTNTLVEQLLQSSPNAPHPQKRLQERADACLLLLLLLLFLIRLRLSICLYSNCFGNNLISI